MVPIRPDNDEKRAVWEAYRQGRPGRVPMALATNPRIIVLDPALNAAGHDFETAARDPRAHVELALAHEHHRRTVLNHFTDDPTGLPDAWRIDLCVYNVYEAASLGAEVVYTRDSVPATEPFLGDENRDSVFDVPVDRPLELPFIRDRLAFWHEMKRICEDLRFEGRPVRLAPWAPVGTDGPLTVGCNLRGESMLLDLVEDPDYADRLLELVARFAVNRRAAFESYWGDEIGRGNNLADDSCAMLSPAMYERCVMPHHQRFYDAAPGRARSLHMCGDATRLFPTIHERLGVTSFDTGFPVDHGALRERLGPDVEIQGGPEVSLLLSGDADAVHERTRAILESGVTAGGRFVLREGNNLPPGVPYENLEAMYAACLEHGRYRAETGGAR